MASLINKLVPKKEVGMKLTFKPIPNNLGMEFGRMDRDNPGRPFNEGFKSKNILNPKLIPISKFPTTVVYCKRGF